MYKNSPYRQPRRRLPPPTLIRQQAQTEAASASSAAQAPAGAGQVPPPTHTVEETVSHNELIRHFGASVCRTIDLLAMLSRNDPKDVHWIELKNGLLYPEPTRAKMSSFEFPLELKMKILLDCLKDTLNTHTPTGSDSEETEATMETEPASPAASPPPPGTSSETPRNQS